MIGLQDIQKWEYVPLGPFLAKNTVSISPWIVTLDALEPFRVAGPKPLKKQLPYLEFNGEKSFDINLEVGIKPENAKNRLFLDQTLNTCIGTCPNNWHIIP